MAKDAIFTAALQFPVSMDTQRNVESLQRLLDPLPSHSFVVAPEGALSGYLPEAGFVERLSQSRTQSAIDSIAAFCRTKRIHLIAGACVRDDKGFWRNRSLYFGPGGERAHYDKINLAQSERGTFTAADELPVFDITVAGQSVRFAIQMCREMRYPEQWRTLAAGGAEIVAYVNNAIGSKTGDSVWRAHMISRAAETQRFVIGANAADDQTCPTMIVSPSGQILAIAALGETIAATAEVDLNSVSN